MDIKTKTVITIAMIVFSAIAKIVDVLEA